MTDLGYRLLTNLCAYDSALSRFEVNLINEFCNLKNYSYYFIQGFYHIYSGIQGRWRMQNMKVVKKRSLVI